MTSHQMITSTNGKATHHQDSFANGPNSAQRSTANRIPITSMGILFLRSGASGEPGTPKDGTIVNPKTAPARAAGRTCASLATGQHATVAGKLVRWFLTALSLAALLPGAAAHADEKLARARNCYACHQVESKLVGPAWRDVATRYARDAQSEARLARKIREGGAGAWGVVAMAPNPAVTDADARALARWVLSLRPAK